MSECGTRRKKGASKGKQHGAHVLRVLKLHEALPHVSGWLRNNHCPQVGPSLDDDRVCESLQLQSSYNGFKVRYLPRCARAHKHQSLSHKITATKGPSYSLEIILTQNEAASMLDYKVHLLY